VASFAVTSSARKQALYIRESILFMKYLRGNIDRSAASVIMLLMEFYC
jgi:hypothetical protein